jgi:tetratricopeptide (TPR) repeat protein
MIARVTAIGKTEQGPRGTGSRASFALLFSVLVLATLCGCGPVSEERRLCDQGLEHEENGDRAKAVECYTQAIAANESYARAYYLRGVEYVAQHEYKKAVDDLTKALALEPEDEMGNWVHWRGVAYRELGEHEMALADFQAAIAKGEKYRHSWRLNSEPALFDEDPRRRWERVLDSYRRDRDEVLQVLQERRKP